MPEVSRDALEAVPPQELVAALGALSRRPPRAGELPQPLLPVVDGATLPVTPIRAVSGGAAASVATIVGTNRDEMTFFALSDPSTHAMDRASLHERLERSAPYVPSDRVVDHYRGVLSKRGEPATPRGLWVAAGSDIVFRWPSLRLAAALRAHSPRTYVYLFTWESPAFGGTLGATHALEIPFVFGTYADPGISPFVVGGGDGAETRGGGGEGNASAGPGSRIRADTLSAAMRDSWVSFARSLDPSNSAVGRWPAWDGDERATMVFGRSVGVERAPRNDELAVWESVAPLPGVAGMASGPTGD
jgi:para-nitrobenzyl esterase